MGTLSQPLKEKKPILCRKLRLLLAFIDDHLISLAQLYGVLFVLIFACVCGCGCGSIVVVELYSR